MTNLLNTWGPTGLAAIGGIIVIIATIWSSVQQNNLQNKLQDKTDEVAILTEESLKV